MKITVALKYEIRILTNVICNLVWKNWWFATSRLHLLANERFRAASVSCCGPRIYGSPFQVVARNEITKEENLVSPFCNLAWLVCLAQLRCPGRHHQVSGAKRIFSLADEAPRTIINFGQRNKTYWASLLAFCAQTRQEGVCYLARSTPRDSPSYFLSFYVGKIMRLERSFPPWVRAKGEVPVYTGNPLWCSTGPYLRRDSILATWSISSEELD